MILDQPFNIRGEIDSMWFVFGGAALIVFGYFLIALSNRIQDSEQVIGFGEKLGRFVQYSIAILLVLVFAGVLFVVYFLHSLWNVQVHL